MRPWLPRADHPRRAALSAFGFGGSNFHAVLEEYRSEKRAVDWDGSVEIVALGADSPQQLAMDLANVPTDWNAFARFAEESRRSFGVTARCRLVFAAHRTLTDLPKLLASARTRLAAEPHATGLAHPRGRALRYRARAGQARRPVPRAGFAIGRHAPRPCLSLPRNARCLAHANRAVSALSQDTTDTRRLSDRIYPPTTFDPDRKRRHEVDLRETRNAQPALGAVSFGAWRVLAERFGLVADAFAGHSYGELVALAAAGRLTPAELFTLSRLRGKLMGEQRTGDAGAMLAVLARFAEIERVLADRTLDLVVANRNAPQPVRAVGFNM